MERSADRALYLQSGDWPMSQRAWRRGIGEIKVTLYLVDAVCEGQGHAGSTPATSTNFLSASRKEKMERDVNPCRLARFHVT